jgi:RNA polymerase sigma factor (sigma-70 family)
MLDDPNILTADAARFVGRAGLPQMMKDRMIADYLRLRSIEKVATKYGRSRQSVWEMLNRAGTPMCKKRPIDVVVYKGRKFTPGKGGYYRDTAIRKAKRGVEVMLQRQVWIDNTGFAIPQGCQIGFKDHDRKNCAFKNLLCLPHAEMARRNACGENGATKARGERLMQENMGFIVNTASGLARHFGVSTDDLIQEGRLSAMRLSRNFEAKRGAPFLAYAAKGIRSAMVRYCGMTRKNIASPWTKVWQTANNEVSLQTPLGDSDRTYADVVGVEENITETAMLADDIGLIERARRILDAREFAVIEGFFLRGRTFVQLGVELGCTAQKVHLVKLKALRKLKRRINFEELQEEAA